MFVYNGKEYGHKVDVVRELYDLGQTSLAIADKKEIAEKLGISVPTVHATIMKHIGKFGNPKPKINKEIAPAIVQAKKKLNEKVAKVKSLTKGTIFINDKDEEVKESLMKDKHKIAVVFAPNQWGLPVTNPPMYVIDENYDPNWVSKPEETIERSWN